MLRAPDRDHLAEEMPVRAEHRSLRMLLTTLDEFCSSLLDDIEAFADPDR